MNKTVTIDEIANAIAAYCDSTILPNLGLDHNAIIFAGVGISLVIKRYKAYVETMRNNETIKMLGVFDEDGNVYIDNLREALVEKLKNDSFDFHIGLIGKTLKLDADDVEEVYKILMK